MTDTMNASVNATPGAGGNPFLYAPEVAAILGIGQDSASTLMRRGSIGGSIVIGGRRCVPAYEVRAYKERQAERHANARSREAGKRG
nr:unnamed protein product [uncultured bacterium]